MTSKFDVRGIVADHFRSFHKAKSDVTSWTDVFVLVMVPLLVAVLLGSLDISVAKDFANGALAAMAIFAGLLLNVLILCVEALRREGTPTRSTDEFQRVIDEERAADRIQLLRETCANISFAVLVAVAAIVLLLARLVGRDPLVPIFEAVPIERAVRDVIYFAIFGSLGVFVATLLMVLKRMHALFAHDKGEN